jgi:transglutaminase-like putative cysteine protease
VSAAGPVRREGWSEAPVTFLVRHITRIRYASPVQEAHSELRLTPVDTGLQRVLASSLSISPEMHRATHDDWFGNRVTRLSLLEPHPAFEAVAESVVRTTDAVACGPETPGEDPRPWEERFAELLAPSTFVPPLAAYADVPHVVRPGLDPEEFLASLEALARTFAERFRYEPGITHAGSTARELFEKEGGVCQDFAHAAIGVLRAGGVPARYASGYLYDPAAPELATHAWTQAFHPELGWVGVDATHRRLVDWQYVRIAVGRDYGDVQPVRGVLRGGGRQSLEVRVEMQRLGGVAGPPDPGA